MGVAVVHSVLRVREGDELMTTTNFEMKDPILEVTCDEHFPLLARVEQDSLRMPGFEFYFDIESVLYSLIVCVEMMHKVRVTNKPWNKVRIIASYPSFYSSILSLTIAFYYLKIRQDRLREFMP